MFPIYCFTFFFTNFSLQNSTETFSTDDAGVCQARYHRRLQLMLRSLLAISGDSLRQRFMSQQLLVKVWVSNFKSNVEHFLKLR
jgi:hypothetical protein